MNDLVSAWNLHQSIVLRLVAALDDLTLDTSWPEGTWTARRHLGHLHDVRLRWAGDTHPLEVEGLVRFEDDPQAHPSRAVLTAALGQSSDLVVRLLEGEGDRPVVGFPGSATEFLAYVLAQENNHLGQIEKFLEAAGRPLPREAAFALWRGWWDEEYRRSQ